MASRTKRIMVLIQLFPPLLVCFLRLRASCGRAYMVLELSWSWVETIPILPSNALSGEGREVPIPPKVSQGDEGGEGEPDNDDDPVSRIFQVDDVGGPRNSSDGDQEY
ncbi:hypothetical protein F5882DRAFT_373876 [Hyaloscypha sp. PMI_1271]|nr:hypothetical protein F5882DRAFT_373876 [Hyaloscypha sp. PMI_1271]